MADLRQRNVPKPDPDSNLSKNSQTKQPTHDAEDDRTGISILDILRVLVALVVASCGLSYYMTSSESVLWGYRPWFTRWPVLVRYFKGPLYLTPAELALYSGSDPSLPIYLAVNGSIFDVSANPMVYGPGGSYHFFTGKDATRAFVTGCFQEDLTPDLTGVEEMFIPIDSEEEIQTLTPAQRKIRREKDVRVAKTKVDKVVNHWENFFRSHKKYYQVGRVVWGEEDRKYEKRELCEAAKQQRPKRGEV